MKKLINAFYSATLRLIGNNSSLSGDGEIGKMQRKDMDYYRNLIFTTFTTYLLPFGLFALLTGIFEAVANGTFVGYLVAVGDLIFGVSLAFMAYSKRIPIKLKKTSIIATFYIIAIFLMVTLGSFGPGALYLIAPTVLMSLIFNDKAGLLSICLNVVVCVFLGFVVTFKLFNSPLGSMYNTGAWVAYSSNIIFLSAIHFVVINKLITSMERKIRMLLRSEARQSGLLASQTNYVFRTDVNGKFTYVNDKYKGDFSWLFENESILGCDLLESLALSSHASLNETINKCHRSSGQVFHAELEMLTQEDETISTLWEFTCIQAEDDSPIEIQGIGVDISERIKAERNFQQSATDLFNRNKELETYAYVISHNLRSPIANLQALINLMEIDKNDPTVMDNYFHYLKQSVASLDHVIRDLSTAVTIAGHCVQLSEIIDLHDVFRSINEDLSGLLKSTETELTMPTKSIFIRSNKAYVYSIFYNIISNAVRFGNKSEPKVTVTLTVNEDEVIVAVKDNGSGIDLKKHLADMFRPYTRFNHTVSGKGLGLFFAKKHIDALNGKLTVVSELDKGSIFTIVLPKEG